MAYRNTSNNPDSDYDYDRTHQYDPESNTTSDYYYEDDALEFYDDYDVNHPEYSRRDKYLFDNDYEYNDYGIGETPVDYEREHPYRRRSTIYNEEEIPHTSAMGARYSPRYQRRYSRLDNPRTARDLSRLDMYAEGAGYADWDTIDEYGIAGNHPHEVMRYRKRYNGPYNYGYENTVPSSRVTREDELHRNRYLPQKSRPLYPELYDKQHGRDRNTFPMEARRGRKNRTGKRSQSRPQKQAVTNKKKFDLVYNDQEEEFLASHEMFKRRGPLTDRTMAYENSGGGGFARYGNYSNGRYAMDDYDDIFDEDTTGRRESRQEYGKGGRRVTRERK